MTRQGQQGHTSDGNTPSSPVGSGQTRPSDRRPSSSDFTLWAHEFLTPEAGYTDAACVPYTATALAIGEESIYGLREVRGTEIS
jgi:hypothetical protein